MDEVTIYIDQLKSNDFETKRLAVEILGELGDTRALTPLLELFSDDEWQIRNSAIDAIVKIDKEKATAPLIDLIKDENVSVRNAAISALQLVGVKAVESLKQGLKDPEDDVKIFTANTLGYIAAKSAVTPLLECLNAPDTQENVCFAVVEALGRIKSYDATPSLVQHLQQADVWDRFNYLNTLGLIGDERAVNAVLGCYRDEETLEAAITAAGLIGDELAVPATIEALYHEDADIQKAALLALFNIKQKVLTRNRLTFLNYARIDFFRRIRKIDFIRIADTIHEIFLEDDLELQRAAIKLIKHSSFQIRQDDLLSLLSRQELLEELEELYQIHPNENISSLCTDIYSQEEQFILNFFNLANVCSIHLPETIIIQAFKHPFIEVKSHAMIYCGLQGIFSPAIVSELTQFLTDASGKLTKSAEGALIMYHDKAFKATVREYLNSGDSILQTFALRYIAFNDFDVSGEELLSLLDAHSEDIRATALLAIRMLLHNEVLRKDEALEQRLLFMMNDDSEKVQIEAISTLVHFLTPNLISEIAPSITGLPNHVKLHGIRAISTHPCDECDDFLIALLTDPHPEIILTAINAMKRSTSPEKVLNALIDNIESFDVDLQAEALEAIGYIGSHRNIPLLVEFLERDNWFLKVSSIKAMGRLKDPDATPHLLKVLDRLKPQGAFEIILEALVHAFGSLKSVEAAVPLSRVIHVGNIQGIITRTFLQIAERDITPFIGLARESDSRLVRAIAVSVLCQRGCNEFDFYWGILLGDELVSVKRITAEAITLIENKESLRHKYHDIKDIDAPSVREILFSYLDNN